MTSALLSWLLVAAAAAIILSLAASAVIALLLRFLPEGRARTLVMLFPYTLVFCRRLLAHRSVPWRARVVLTSGLLYAASPITLVPDFIPVIGKLDNVLAVVIAIRLSVAFIPVPVLIEAWPGERGQLRMLAGARIPKEEVRR
jgi:uncharacterized membrane protein YkvA (DUF1232 family)